MGLDGRASRCSATRSTSSSSAAAPTRGSPTCARPPASSRAARWRRGVRVLVVPGLAGGQAGGRGRGARPGVPRGGRRVARAGLLDVHRDERRPARARAVRRQHQQPQLRGPAGRGRPHVPASPLTAAAAAVTGGHRSQGSSRNGAAPTNRSRRSRDRRAAERRTSTPTRSSRRGSSRRPARTGLGDAPVRRLALRRRRQREPDFVLNRPEAQTSPGRRCWWRAQLRLRLVARARAVGAARLRLPRRRRARRSPTSSATTR